MAMENDQVLTLEDVCKLLRVHSSTIYRLLKKKQLPAFKVGRDWRFGLDSINKWRRDMECNQTNATNQSR